MYRTVIALVRPGHRFIFIVDDDPESIAALWRTLTEMANDAELVFSNEDARSVWLRAVEVEAGLQ